MLLSMRRRSDSVLLHTQHSDTKGTPTFIKSEALDPVHPKTGTAVVLHWSGFRDPPSSPDPEMFNF